MKILMLCDCGKKITLEKSDGIFKTTCRACHREHRLQAEIGDHEIKQTHRAARPRLLDFSLSPEDNYFPLM